MIDCPKGHQLNEDGLCGTCWELNPASPNYRNAKQTGAHWPLSPPRSNEGDDPAFTSGIEEARRQSRPDDVT